MNLVQGAVHPHPDDGAVLVGLEVDVGGAGLHGPQEEGVELTDHGGVGGIGQQVAADVQVDLGAFALLGLAQTLPFHHQPAQPLLELFGAHQDGADILAQRQPDVFKQLPGGA